MPRQRARRLIISATVILLATAGAVAVAGTASAAASDITLGQTLTFASDNGTGSVTTSAGTIGNGTDNGCQGGFINLQIPATITNAGAAGADGVAGSGATAPGLGCPVATGDDPRGEGGQYRIMTNLWDENNTWNCANITGPRATAANCQATGDQKTSSNLLLAVDSTKTATTTGTQYEYNKYDADTYFPNGRPGNTANCPQTGTFTDNTVTPAVTRSNTDRPCHWTPTQAHFPSSYPAMYKGCNFAQCSFAKGTDPATQANGPVQASAALPAKLSSVLSLNSHWVVNLPTADGTGIPKAPTDGVYDVAYDIWLDRGDNTAINGFPKLTTVTGEALPGQAFNLEQNNGAEVMLWIDNSGYAGHGAPDGNPAHVVTPAGKFVGTYTDSNLFGWDVWIGRQNMPDTVDANGSPTKGGPLPQWKCHYDQNRITPLTNDVSVGTSDNAGPRSIPSSQNTHCSQWNIVTYVRQTGTRDFQADASEFLFNALNYQAGDSNLAANVPNSPMSLADLQTYLASVCPQQPFAADQLGNTAPGQCISPNWWLTSVQTGMEVWNLPGTNGGSATPGSKLGTKFLSVNPMTAFGTTNPNNTGITGRDMHIVGGTPTKERATIHFNDEWLLSYSGCPSADPNATAQWNVDTTAPATHKQGVLKQVKVGTGLWESDPPIPGLNPGHDNTMVTITGLPSCGDPAVPSGTVFVDPSGHVITTSGMPINGASVTIGRCTVANPAPNVACPAPALNLIVPQTVTEITPAANPADNSGPGSFRWDVQPGQYTVTASATGCTTRTIGPLTVPPPQIGLLIVLDCATTAPGIRAVSGGTYTAPPPAGGGGNLPTQVVVRGGGIPPHGYCADIFVTNNTSAPVEWNTNFAVPGNQHIAQAWNIAFSQGGSPNTATNVHADAGSQSWNKMLAPGATTHDVGFCTVFS